MGKAKAVKSLLNRVASHCIVKIAMEDLVRIKVHSLSVSATLHFTVVD